MSDDFCLLAFFYRSLAMVYLCELRISVLNLSIDSNQNLWRTDLMNANKFSGEQKEAQAIV